MPVVPAEEFHWGDIDERLLSPKISDLAEEMHKRIAEGERKVAFDARQSGNTAGCLPRLFDLHEQLTDEWAKRLYTAHCEAWAQQNRAVSAAFIRTVRDRAILQLIAVRKSSVQSEACRRGTATNQQPNPIALGAWNRKMNRLAGRWNRKLEAEAVVTEYRASNDVDDDRRFALMAIAEARKSTPEDGKPRPKVGAVVVKDGIVLAVAHRGEVKGNHAEYIALEKKLPDAAVAGATVYTTLEPCTTRNLPKIPCVERIIARKIKRVVIGMLDPDPRITGRGQRSLRNANIITDFFPHDLMSQVEDLNREFTKNCESPAKDDLEVVLPVPDSMLQTTDQVGLNDPRIYVDVLDRRDGLASGAIPATMFRLWNRGGSVAHKIQVQPIGGSFGEAVFEQVDSIAVGESREVVPEIARYGIFQKHDIAHLLMKQWDAAGEPTKKYVVGCSVTYEEYKGKVKFESKFDLVYSPTQDISRQSRNTQGKTRPTDPEILQVTNSSFKRLSDAVSQSRVGRLMPQESDDANATVSAATNLIRTEPKAIAHAPGATGEDAPGGDAFSEDLERHARQVVGCVMTLNGQHLLRQLLIHGRFRSTQQFIPEISMNTQNEQMSIATEVGIVKQEQGTPPVAGGYYTINPRFLEVLKKVVYEELAKHQ